MDKKDDGLPSSADGLRRTISEWAGRHRYFQTYIVAVCREWMDFLFGVGPLAAIFLIYWALANPGNWPLVVIFVVALILAGFYAWYAEYSKNIPKFDVRSCITRRRDTTSLTVEQKCIQLKPVCLTESPVVECEATLNRVLRKSETGEWIDTGINEPIPLIWASRYGKGPRITLERRVECPVNVCHTDNIISVKRIYPDALPEQLPIRSDLEFPGVFSFEIKFTAKDCHAIYRSLEVTVGDSWEKIQCVLWSGWIDDQNREKLQAI